MSFRVPATVVLVSALLLGGCTGDQPTAAAPTPSPVWSSAAPADGRSATELPPAPDSTGPVGPTTASPGPSASAPNPTKPPVPAVGSGPLGTKRTTGVRAVALTFDDGPHPVWTPKVLDYLKATGVKATFCLIGVKVRKNPELVRRIVREGHQLCNHSWSHDLKLGSKTPAEIQADLTRTNDEIHKAVPGVPIPYFRQPGGEWTASEVAVTRQLGMIPLDWDVDPRDWAKPGTAAIIQRVESHARPGAVVLMHDGGGDRSGTLGACPEVIPWLRKHFGIVRLA